MTFLEAMKELSEGKKVRRKGWDREYLFSDNGVIRSSCGSKNLNLYTGYDYELYQEQKKKKKMKLLAYVDINDGTMAYRTENKARCLYAGFKRCPELDKEVEVEL